MIVRRIGFAAITLSIWALLVRAVLGFATHRTDWDGVLCGPWGCTPPLSVILACHAAWALTVFPAAAFAWRHLPGSAVIHLAKCLAFGSCFVLTVIAAFAIYPHLRVELRPARYLGQRVAVDALAYVDLPVLEILFAASFLGIANATFERSADGGTPPKTA